jgi:hypothetical protein
MHTTARKLGSTVSNLRAHVSKSLNTKDVTHNLAESGKELDPEPPVLSVSERSSTVNAFIPANLIVTATKSAPVTGF